ncbi:hypothetical protein ABZV94_39245, partial [Streptomyces sp. NPDC004658]
WNRPTPSAATTSTGPPAPSTSPSPSPTAWARSHLRLRAGQRGRYALNSGNRVVLVRADGTVTTVLTAADGLSNPTSVAVRGRTVYVPSAASTTRRDPNLLLARLRHLIGRG